MHKSHPRHEERGFTLIEVMIVVLIVGLLGAISVPAYQGAITKARRMALVAEARNLHSAMTRFHVDEGAYPAEAGAEGLDTQTLDPLASRGYLTQASSFTSKLENGRLALYIAPDFGGTDTHYLAFMRHYLDSSIVVLTADINLLGADFNGVYVLSSAGTWVRADEVDG